MRDHQLFSEPSQRPKGPMMLAHRAQMVTLRAATRPDRLLKNELIRVDSFPDCRWAMGLTGLALTYSSMARPDEEVSDHVRQDYSESYHVG